MFKVSKKELKDIFTMAWPAILQELLATVVTYVDTAMVGAMGAHSSAAVGLTGTVMWLVTSIPGAFGVGVLSVCAQADGAEDDDLMKKAGQQALFITLIIGIILTIACLAVSPFLCRWLGGDEEILKDATLYFQITMLPLVFRIAVIMFSSALRGVSDMKTPMYINLGMNLINIIFNFFLIYPERQFLGITIPGSNLGVSGAAIASAISFVVGGTVMFIRFYGNERFGFKGTGFKYDRDTMKKCLEIGFPAAVKRSIICMGHTVFSSMIASLGVQAFAAHTIALQAEQAFYIPGNGLQSAATTLAGNAVGENDEDKLKHTSLLICGITFLLMLVAGTVLFLFAEQLMGIFTPDEEVIRLGAGVLRIVAVSEPIYGVMVIMEGVFDGMGDTKAPVLYAIITMWGIRVLGSYIMVNILHMGLKAVWVMMVADNVGRCLLLLIRFIKRERRFDE